MTDELVDAVNQVQSSLLVASEEVFSVAAEAQSRCPTVKASCVVRCSTGLSVSPDCNIM